MRSPKRTSRALVRWATTAALLLAFAPAAPAQAASSQDRPDSLTVEEASVRVGPEAAELSAEFADGSDLSVSLSDGEVLVDGEPAAAYEPGGELATAWRDFLRDRVDPTSAGLAASVRAWSPPAGADTAAARAIGDALARIAAGGETSPAGDRGPEPPERAEGAPADTIDPVDRDTRVAPSGRTLRQLDTRLEELRSALEKVGRGAAAALGDAALVVHDDHEIPADRVVDGAVALLSGELRVAGDVDGDILVLDGELVLESGSSVDGDVLQVGGTVTKRGGRIDGELVTVGGREAIARDVGEAEDLGDRIEERIERRLDEQFGRDRGRRVRGESLGEAVWDNVTDGFGALFTTFSFFLVLAVLGAIPLYFVPSHFETMARTVRHSFGRSFLLGLAGQVLFLPALVVLAVGILTIPLIPVFVFGVALASVLGYLAVAFSLGRVIQAREYGWLPGGDGGEYRRLFLGIAALLSLFAVLSLLEFVHGIAEPLFVLTLMGALTVTWVASTAGFGAVMLSYAGRRDDYAGPGGPGAGGPGGGPGPVPSPGSETPPPGPETGGPPPGEAPVEPGRASPAPEEPGPRAGGEPAGDRSPGRREPPPGEEGGAPAEEPATPTDESPPGTDEEGDAGGGDDPKAGPERRG